MDVLRRIKSGILLLGIKESDGSYGFRVRAYIAIQVALVTNIFCFLLDRWQSVDDRIYVLKAWAFIMTFVVFSGSLVYYWGEFSFMIQLLGEMYYKIPYAISHKRRRVIRSLEENMRGFDQMWSWMVVAYTSFTTIFPLALVLVRVSFFSEQLHHVIKENLSVQYPLYYPKLLARSLDVLVFGFGYLVHTVYMIFTSVYAHLVNVTTLCAMTNLEHELKLLALSLNEMDVFMGHSKTSNQTQRNHSLKFFLKYFVHHHQETCRKFESVNRGIRWVTSIISFIASLYMCMSIYTIAQKDEIFPKIQEAVFLAVWALDIYLFDVCGERVKTEGENLRNALYECPWLDKPMWFKSSLLIAMTRTTKSIDLKPFGLFSLNLNSYALTMNAAYSYYNLLRNFKIG